MTPRAKGVLAFVLVVILAFMTWWNVLRPAVAGGSVALGRGQDAMKPPFVADDVPAVVFARGEARDGETFSSIRNNLFVYEKSPAVIAKEEEDRKAAAAAMEAARLVQEDQRKKQAELDRIADEERAKVEAARREEAIRNPPKPPPPIPPDFKYQYIGVIGPDSGRYAILQDGSQAFSFAKAGEVIDNQFRVERVGRLNLDLTYTDNRFAGQFQQVPRQFSEGAASPAATSTPPSKPAPTLRRK